MNRSDIVQRLKTKHYTLTAGSRTEIGNVNADRMRFIIDILLFGVGTDDTVLIEKLETDGSTYTPKFKGVNVPAKGNISISPRFDIENPILKLEGGTKLYAKPTSTNVELTVIYYDNIIS